MSDPRETLERLTVEFDERAEDIKHDADATYAACEGNPDDVRGCEAMDAEAARYKEWATAIRAFLEENERLNRMVDDLQAECERQDTARTLAEARIEAALAAADELSSAYHDGPLSQIGPAIGRLKRALRGEG